MTSCVVFLPVPSQADKRAHHNALERKRRDHIKDSFHSLRDSVPSLQGEKVRGKCIWFLHSTSLTNNIIKFGEMICATCKNFPSVCHVSVPHMPRRIQHRLTFLNSVIQPCHPSCGQLAVHMGRKPE